MHMKTFDKLGWYLLIGIVIAGMVYAYDINIKDFSMTVDDSLWDKATDGGKTDDETALKQIIEKGLTTDGNSELETAKKEFATSFRTIYNSNDIKQINDAKTCLQK